MKRLILFFLIALLLMSPVLSYSVPDDTIVYVTPHGGKYHTSDCSYLDTYNSMTIKEAERQGYEPCSRCDPDTTVLKSDVPQKEPSKLSFPEVLLLVIKIFLILWALIGIILFVDDLKRMNS